jgi:hypothetical protein
MGVGVDAEDAAEFQGAAVPAPVKIEPMRIGVDLDGDLVGGAGLQDALDIDLVTLAAQKQAAGHVAEDRRERVCYGADDAIRLRLRLEPERLWTLATTKSNLARISAG